MMTLLTVLIAMALLVALGVIGLVLALALFFRVVGRIFGCGSGMRLRTGEASPRWKICPDGRCQRVNGPAARFCGRCGRPLLPAYDVSSYG